MSDWAPVVHIWGPDAHHDPAYVVGNRSGLALLRDAITAALEDGYGQREPFTSDGEGFTVEVQCVDDTDRLLLPYTSDWARDLDPDRVAPWGETKP